MKNLKLKICGMRDHENITEVAALAPDYMGFIFYEKSPRHFSGNQLQPLGAIRKTGVFVNAHEQFILEKVNELDLSAIQLHGDETPGFCRNLRVLLQEKQPEIIKVFGVQTREDLLPAGDYEGVVDLFLFDTRGESRGGTGKAFDWALLEDYPLNTPFFLSGGISPSSTERLLTLYEYFRSSNKINPFYGIDVNSRFETFPGMKDTQVLKEFISKIKSRQDGLPGK